MFDKYPLPWELVETQKGEYIKAANNEVIVSEHKNLYIFDILEFINNFARSRITDAQCECSCGWQGIVEDCIPDVDGNGRLGCPECEAIIWAVG